MRDKSKETIGLFFIREYHKLVGFVRKRIDDEASRDAEDVVQDVMAGIFDTADITLPIENLASYIYQSLKNKIVDLFRKKKNVISLDQAVSKNSHQTLKDVLQDPRINIEKEWETKEICRYLYKAIDSLEKEEKAIIIATEFENRSFQEMSAEWNIPLGTLLSRKSRALKKIQKALLNNKNLLMEV
ncbi:MAG: sigma-70 family RNA polymerase sigma factor [Spirochaetes bacterium]|nr:sigma-70 family RNA polymerase sigma factor [Spirochaetota bacterium]